MSRGAAARTAALATDPSPLVRRTMAIELGALLDRWSPLDRTWLVAEWATSSRCELRLAAARALCRPFSVLGAHTALDLLGRDDHAIVRHAARSAARLRHQAGLA